jgi:hypothetical protein
MRQLLRKSATLRKAYRRLQQFSAARRFTAESQSDECRIIAKLAKNVPRTFVEFGFHPSEFNCAALAHSPKWKGLLIDSNPQVISDSKMLPSHIKVVEAFLTLDNLDFIKSNFDQVGVLSIDVDGNDYWMLKSLIDTSPSVICIEYNATFGFRSITVPYDPSFDRHEKHASGWYHGASITALAKLAASHGYGLAAVSDAGLNAFFTKNGTLDPKEAWKPNKLRELYSGVPYERQWEVIEHLPFVEI